MEIRKTDNAIELVLSKRNLLSLLTKLDMPGSHRTIYYTDPVYGVFIVVAEPDDEHYATKGTIPGEMHPDTEMDIRENKGTSSS